MAELIDTIETNAAKPKRVQADGQSVEQHPLPDQIEAARFVNEAAAKAKGLGIKICKILPGGPAD
jgi:hypothetical protein